MSNVPYLFEGLVALSFFLLGMFAKSYFPGYLQRKGENLATKEDIAEITRRIESVRATVTFEADRRKQYLDSRIELLMQFHDQLVEFFYERLAVNFGDFPNDYGKSLFEYQATFYKDMAEILKGYQRLLVYFPADAAVLVVAIEIVQTTIEIRRIHKARFGPVKRTAVAEQHAWESGDASQRDAAIEAANKANSAFWSEMSPHVENLRGQLQRFIAEMNSLVAPPATAPYLRPRS